MRWIVENHLLLPRLRIKIYSAPIIAFFIAALSLIIVLETSGQITIVKGQIIELGSELPVAFANVHFKGTSIGTVSDTAGHFEITIATNKILIDSLVISHLIFDNRVLKIEKDKTQFLRIDLSSDFVMLNELVVTPGENPAWPILRKVIRAKSQNDPDQKDRFFCEEYAKTRFDLNHFTDKIKKNILVKPFDYLWDNVNQTGEGVSYLPLLFVEKVIHHYYQKDPTARRDSILANNTVGFPGKKMLEFTDDLYFTPNFYNNYVVMLEKNFTSPLNDNYKQHYTFYLLDSIKPPGRKQYRIAFKPKSKRSLSFTGEMTIDSATWALSSIELQFNILANINFVRSYLMNQSFELLNDQHWMLKKSEVLGDFTVLENVSDMTGFFGRKKSTFRSYLINEDLPRELVTPGKTITHSFEGQERDENFWATVRADSLSKEELGVVTMVTRLEKDPKFIFRKNLIQAVITGYVPVGPVEMGHLYTFYSSNSIEKSRFKLGFRKHHDGLKSWRASGYLAYGIGDEKWKYGGKVDLRFQAKKRFTPALSVQYRNDLLQFGRSPNQLPLDHLFSSWVQLSELGNSVNYQKLLNLGIAGYWKKGVGLGLSFFNENQERPSGKFFERLQSNGSFDPIQQLSIRGLKLRFKYSWQNDNMNLDFYDKDNLKNTFRPFPDLAFEWSFADNNITPTDFDFNKFKISLRQQLRVKKYGYFKYYIESGKTIGNVAYTHLDIPFGNPLVFYDDQAFNLMNFMEYAADEYVAVDLQHHFDGFILDRLPLINKLKWRSFIFTKGFVGRYNKENEAIAYRFPEGLDPISKPYVEVGFGLENIFKIARMDFIWRLSDSKRDDVYGFLIKPSFSFSF